MYVTARGTLNYIEASDNGLKLVINDTTFNILVTDYKVPLSPHLASLVGKVVTYVSSGNKAAVIYQNVTDLWCDRDELLFITYANSFNN